MKFPSLNFFIIFAVIACTTSATLTPNTEKERFLVASGTFSFTTFTLIKVSTTITSVFTTTSTCTTSTAALTTCTVGRRRRGLFYDEMESLSRHRRGLFFNDDETHNKDGTVFLPFDKSNADPINEVSTLPLSKEDVIPLEIQSGFTFPENAGASRFLLAFGTSTVTSISITTTYVSLTAICSSTSGFPLCGGVGK